VTLLTNLYKNRFIINAILIAVGYQLFTTIITHLPFIDTFDQNYSIAYRAITLFIAIFVIITNPVRIKYRHQIFIYLIIWILYLIRVNYDLFIRIDSIQIPLQSKLYLSQFIIGSTFIPAISILFSIHKIDLHVLSSYIYRLLLFVIIIAVFSHLINPDKLSFYGRISLNKGQSPLVFGYYSSLLSLFSIHYLKNGINTKTQITLHWSILIIGIVGLGLSGSRGPAIAFILALLLPEIAKMRIKNIIYFAFLSFSLVLFSTHYIRIATNLFPTLTYRLSEMFLLGDYGGRDIIYARGIQQIADYPIFGNWFMFDLNYSVTNSAHNALIGATMSLGVIVGVLFTYMYIWIIWKSIYFIKKGAYITPFCYAALLSIFYSLFTGGDLIMKAEFNMFFLVILILGNKHNEHLLWSK